MSEKINQIFSKARTAFNDHLEMLYIQALSKIELNPVNSKKELAALMIEEWLKKRGYTLNYILKKPVMTKGFVVCFISEKYVEVWHDWPGRLNHRSVFISESLLTGLPITLNYMERL